MALTKQEIQHERVRLLRKKFRLSQQYIADFCGYTKQHISNIENKNSCIDEEFLWKLSNILLCSSDYLLGLVDAPDQILSDYRDENGERLCLSSPFQLGNFRDALIRKIYIMSPHRRTILYTLIDCLKNCSDTDVKTFERISKAFFHYNPRYEKATPRCHDYIFTRLRDEILPDIEEDAYKFIFSTYSSDLNLCTMSDSDFEYAINQNLGDFKKECKQKFQLKIKGAVIPYKQTPDNSISKNEIDDMIDYVWECIKNDVEAKFSSNSFKEKFKSSKYISSTNNYIAPKDISQILDDFVASIKVDIKKKLNEEPIETLSIKSPKEKANILNSLQHTLYSRRDTYVKKFLNDIKQFFITR